jgi:hypothetical protein
MRALATAILASIGVLLVLGGSYAVRSNAPQERIWLVVNEAGRRVDVTIDGQPFTSYIWPARLAKPVLYPLRTAKGTIVTRGYPLEPRAGERVDHPHHVGLWFNYESVNGLDFWNNSEAIQPENASKMGSIEQRSIVSAKNGTDRGELEVQADWTTYDKKVLLKEDTRFVFAVALTFGVWIGLRRFAHKNKRSPLPTRKTACWVCAWTAHWKCPPISRRSMRMPAAG